MTAAPPVSLSPEARALLQERMAASGIARPVARIGMNMGGAAPKPSDPDGPDWTIRRRDLWVLSIGEEKIPDGDPRIVMVEGLPFVCEFFPMRFQVSAQDGKFRVAASA